jgi:glycosyltransferase involved in cell wall biosynthesis
LLIVSHNAGGGTEMHVHDLITICKDRANVLLLEPRSKPWVRLSSCDPVSRVSLHFDVSEDLHSLVQVLRNCNVSRAHIHHLYNNEHYLCRLVEALDFPFDFTLHDYYVLSPQPHLVDRENRFVGEDLRAAADKLLRAGIAPTRPRSLDEWQSATRWLVTEASRVIVPSQDAQRRLTANLPEARTTVAAHPWIADEISPLAMSADTASPLRIGMLGTISEHKGAKVLLACAKLAQSRGHPLQFVVIGSVDARYRRKMQSAGVTITGAYHRSQLRGLVVEHRPALLWYASQCPETYSYTLSEGLILGLPLAVVDLGALPERVAGRPATWIKPWNLTPEQWIAFFLGVRGELSAASLSPPFLAEPPPAARSRFYQGEYLSWADRARCKLNGD